MSCAIALAASLALADLYGAGHASQVSAAQAQGASALSREPFYADIVQRAHSLHEVVVRYRTPDMKASATPMSLADFAALKVGATELSALDMQGHFDLAKRDSDGDLKCILKGISQDLPKKLALVEAARTGKDQDAALDDLAYLLNDNVEVITAPARPPV